MPFEVKSNNEPVKPILRMGHRLETTRHHESSSAGAAEEIKSSQANRSSKSRDKYKVENTVNKPYINRHHDPSKNQNVIQLSSSDNSFGSKENKDDELVKYMSNLPGYLQHAEKGKNIQGKALNFGVLDWERLEKWKYNERMPAKCHRKTLSVSSPFVARRPPTAYGMSFQRKQMPLLGGSASEQKLAEPVQRSQSEFMQTQDLQTTRCPTKHAKQKQRVRKEIPSQRRNSELNIGKYMGSEDLSSVHIKNVNIPSGHTNSVQDCKSEIKFGNEVNPTTQNCATEPKNIVLLVPKHRSETSMEDSQFSESRTSFDEQSAEAMRTRFSDCSSLESYSSELHAVPRSCPLPASSATNTESHVKQHQLPNARGIKSDLRSSPCQNERITTRSSFDAKYLNHHKCDAELGVPAETSQRKDLDTAEQPVAKGRHPSPNKRFSFSLSRMSRSFSFKETSAVSPLNSTNSIPRSGPVGASSSMDISNLEKPNAGVRGRSSPLRRLLDPLLRPKGLHSAETCPPPNGNSNGNTLPTNHSKHVRMKKHQSSTLQALLQLTLKDGVPFFKLVVDDDGGILAAAVKKLPTYGKGGSSLVYAFYAVHEIKRKSGGWMSQGTKEKSAGFGYKVIGQMEISSSKVLNSSINDHKNISVRRESVLYSIDSGQVDKQVPDSSQKRDLASIVIMNSSQNQIGTDTMLDQYKQEAMQHLPGETCETGESKTCGDVVVILPGGTHSLPNDGAPSSLLERWKSGGVCDCGGWDVGCKLKVLEQDKNCRNQDFLNLFIQGGDPRSKPIFSMAPLKNRLYSVEFDSSVPLLEAFSICVSALTSHKLADIFEIGSLGQKPMKTSTTVQAQVPQRYVSSPPPSPVGRI
ncbi:uncharacterized protein LOC107780221 [Nicotiana tabacum]|uniref:Uncharacterized protein LOC107780221 n=2 Tax=Nicotiana TaxID=4085 RepID=A0A1S3YWB1_TOBAC|nr:PREDICTED: uncharacterized protein LOC104241694 [Nicotiana sylvestris]XP_016456242.1 PREDICTED: uncharacterized protein LOC107780221 [Nicotiana tabacum]